MLQMYFQGHKLVAVIKVVLPKQSPRNAVQQFRKKPVRSCYGEILLFGEMLGEHL